MAAAPSGQEPALRLRVLATPRHDCGGCSSCCSSYRIGPLSEADRSRLAQALPRLHEAYPDQLNAAPTYSALHGEQQAHFLRKSEGFCVLYRQGLGCTLHASAGAEHKPLVCQLFPLQLIRDQEQIRLGNRPTCLRDAMVWEKGSPLAGEFLERVLPLSPRAPSRPEQRAEASVVALLRLPDLDTGTLLSFLAEHPTPHNPPSIDSWLQARLLDLFQAADSVTGGEFDANNQGPLHPNTRTSDEFSDFRDWAEARSDRDWPEVHQTALTYLRDALQRLVFLRQTSLYPGLEWALLAYISAARWASAYCRQDGDFFDMARFGRLFATLLIILESPRMQRALVHQGPPFA